MISATFFLKFEKLLKKLLKKVEKFGWN